jgi:uncharacterized protein (UPF0335 family)
MGDADLKLKKYIDTIENLEIEKKDITRQINDIYKEAKVFGFNTQALKKVIALRKTDPDKRVELENLIEAYKEVLGMK